MSDVAVDGRLLALATPEIFEAPETGLARILDLGPADAPDPAGAREVASWEPPGNLANTMPLLYSPHEFTIRDGVAYVSLFHGGVWALKVEPSGLEPVGWFFPPIPAGWTPAANAPAAPWFECALAAEDGFVYATDMATGVWILRPAPAA